MFNNFTFNRALVLMLVAHSFVYAQTAEPPKRALLPTLDQLLDSKLSAIKSSIGELDNLLSNAKKELSKEQGIEKQIFNGNAFLSLSIKNTAPSSDYRLESTEVYFDNAKKPLARGGINNQGLPRKSELFFGAIEPGCHEIKVKARYVRLKSDLISKFGVNRVENIEVIQPFIATNGYRVELDIEGYESLNTFANFYRGPAIRFNKSARPNFLPGAPIISMDEVLKQGQVHINYITEDNSSHTLLSKSLKIDGLPILKEEKVSASDGAVIFDGPLTSGKHRLSATLVFAQKKWVTGGPSYNFKLNFEHDFYVLSGQTTLIDLAGMPKGGIKSSLADTRYARSTSRILSKEYSEFFPEGRCPKEKAKVPVKVEEKPVQETKPLAPVEEKPASEPTVGE